MVGTRASNVVAYIDTTSSFGVKFRMEKVGGNRIEVAVSSHRNLSFSEEKKVRFRGGEVMLHRVEIRAKAPNVAEMNRERAGGGIRTSCGVVTWSEAWSGDISGPLPRRGLRGTIIRRHFFINFEF